MRKAFVANEILRPRQPAQRDPSRHCGELKAQFRRAAAQRAYGKQPETFSVTEMADAMVLLKKSKEIWRGRIRRGEQSKSRSPVAFHQRRSCSMAAEDVREPADKPVAMIAVVVSDHMMPIFVGLCGGLQSSERKHTDGSRRGEHEDCSAHCETPVA
jgi:hypothetical protein